MNLENLRERVRLWGMGDIHEEEFYAVLDRLEKAEKVVKAVTAQRHRRIKTREALRAYGEVSA